MRNPTPLLTVAVALIAGCRPAPTGTVVASLSVPVVVAGSAFDPARCGTLAGRVTWDGDGPTVSALEAVGSAGAVPNPHAPKIDPTSRRLTGAVVFLRGISPAAGRPWDLPPARVDQSPAAIEVVQGDEPPQAVGFVRRGADVAMRSTAAGTLSLRARGAAFFTLAFPDPDRPLTRRFDTNGHVELTSGTGQFWHAADLFVADHPYYAVTGPDGSFTLPQVPAGEHELVAWVRDWHVTGKDRDPETGLVIRLRYAAPVEKSAAVWVEPNQIADADLTVSADDFGKR